MSPRTIIVIVLALVFGLVAALLVHSIVVKPPETGVNEEGVDVVVAVTEIQGGSAMTSEMVTLRKYRKDLVPKNALTSLESIMERAAKTTIPEGVPVVDSALTPKGQLGLGPLVSPGMRAYSAQVVDTAAGVSGFILPRSYVDVLVTLRGSGSSEEEQPVTAILLAKVQVLAVGGAISNNANSSRIEDKMRTVTFLVSPEQAAKLELGARMGTLHLTLRNQLDEETPEVAPATMASIRAATGLAPVVPDQLNNNNADIDGRFAALKTQLLELQDERIRALEEKLAAAGGTGGGQTIGGMPGKGGPVALIQLIRGTSISYAQMSLGKQPDSEKKP